MISRNLKQKVIHFPPFRPHFRRYRLPIRLLSVHRTPIGQSRARAPHVQRRSLEEVGEYLGVSGTGVFFLLFRVWGVFLDWLSSRANNAFPVPCTVSVHVADQLGGRLLFAI